MELSVLGDLNWFATLGSGIVYYVLGALWFSPRMFGSHWQTAIGWDEPESPDPTIAMIAGPLATCVIAAIAVSATGQATGSEGLWQGIVLGLILGAGIAGTALGVLAIVEPKMPRPGLWFAVTATYHLVGILIVAVTTSIWN